MAITRIKPLDGLRARAALSVLSYHVAELMGNTCGGGLGAVLSQLKADVPVFLVISGFVIYLPWARAARSGTPRPTLAAFARRRAARILPAYWVALTVWLVLLAIASAQTAHWVGDYGLFQVYSLHNLSGGLAPAWSLCVEVAFYLMLPVLGWGLPLLSGRLPASMVRRQLVMIGGFAAASLGLRVGFSGSMLGAVPVTRAVIATALPATFDWFAVGLAIAVLAAEWAADPDAFAQVRRLADAPGRCWLVGLALLVAAIPSGDVYPPLDSVAANVLIAFGSGLLLLPVAVPAAMARPSRILAMLGSPRIVRLGTSSYGIFLYNVPMVAVVRAIGFGVPVSQFLGFLSTQLRLCRSGSSSSSPRSVSARSAGT
jgi:peptidoglycan/LPS O-acetylase OafA/YrhL